jgi:hypothetical protein
MKTTRKPMDKEMKMAMNYFEPSRKPALGHPTKLDLQKTAAKRAQKQKLAASQALPLERPVVGVKPSEEATKKKVVIEEEEEVFADDAFIIPVQALSEQKMRDCE